MKHAATTAALALRSALYMALMVATVLPYSVGVLAWCWLPHPQRYWMITGWTRLGLIAARHLCGLRFEVIGRENLPDMAVILQPKHQSAWEAFWLTIAMPRPLNFVYKRELNYVPFFGWALSTLDWINIDRKHGSDAFEQVLQQGTPWLARGWWIVIFPEGTRTAPGATPRYKTGGARLAVRTGVPVVPIAHNAGELWPRRAFIKTPGTITVSIGPPIFPDGRSADEMAALIEGWIEGEMHRIAPHRYTPDQLAARAGATRVPVTRAF
jgi:1-acyl-sn-glycerol-3-phosphate acyltransferase